MTVHPTAVATPHLDHIVILVPHSFLVSPPRWLADVFAFYPGGRHADGLTENTLVLLPDGSYLEFIAFMPGVDPSRRDDHKWGRQKEGTVIDWAFTLPQSPEGDAVVDVVGEQQKAAFDKIREKVEGTGTGISYGELVPGGRRRPDGEVLKWAVAGAYRSKQDGDGAIEPIAPGQLPFWCLDDTPRHLRVPYLQEHGGSTKHPAGVVGVALVSVTPGGDAEDAGSLDKVYSALLRGREPEEEDSLWDLKTLDGEKLHDGGQVRFESVAEGVAPGISVAFFTDSEEFVGSRVGGEVDGGALLEFELVAARSGS
jgi:hypothetical protein